MKEDITPCAFLEAVKAYDARPRDGALKSSVFLREAGWPEGMLIYEDVPLSALTGEHPGGSLCAWAGPEPVIQYVFCLGSKAVCAYIPEVGTDDEMEAVMDAFRGPLKTLPASIPAYGFSGECLKAAVIRRADTGLTLKATVPDEVRGSVTCRMLRDRHMIDAGNKITMFGMECGLVYCMKVKPDGSLERRLRIWEDSVDLFTQGLAYSRSRRVCEDGGGTIAARLERIGQGMPASLREQEAVWPKAVKAVRETLATPLERLEQVLAGHHPEWCGDMSEALGLPDTAGFHRVLSAVDRAVRANPGDRQIYDLAMLACQYLAGHPKPKPLPPGTSVKEQIKCLFTARTLPMGELTLRDYLQALALISDSSYPLWLFQASGMEPLLQDEYITTRTTLVAAIRDILTGCSRDRLDTQYGCELCYGLLVMPTAGVKQGDV